MNLTEKTQKLASFWKGTVLHHITLNSNLTQGKERDFMHRKWKNPKLKHQIAVMSEPNEGQCHCKLPAAPKGGRADKVWRWDCSMSHARVHLQKGQWGMEQGPAGITQLLCEFTFPTPWLFSPIPVCPSTRHLLFGKSGLFPWKMYTLKLLEAVL